MTPTLHDGDIVLVDLGRRAPTPSGIFVLHDGMGLVAKRLEHMPNNDPPRVRIISDNPLYKPYEGGGERSTSLDEYGVSRYRSGAFDMPWDWRTQPRND